MKRTSRKTLLLCLLLAPLAHGAAAETPADQVVVEATRTNLTKLAKQINEVQFRFYRRYNELNTQRDYAINCYSEAPPNSRLNKQYCQPVFQTKAQAEESRSFFLGLTAMYSYPGLPTPTAVAAAKPGFQKNVLEVTSKSPELIEILKEHAALIKRYQDMYGVLNGMKTESK